LGEVEFKHVAMRYRPGLPLVLRGVSFKAASKEKVRVSIKKGRAPLTVPFFTSLIALPQVGIVGRTGAGKSSMFGCLFRLTEVETGEIKIDGVSISKVTSSSTVLGI
jgi:ABC-type multidrug transport system fused ATPase/permease subunit